MNENIAKGNWAALKGLVKKQWGELTDDEINKTEGNVEQLAGKIQAKYGIEQDKAHQQLNSILDSINNKLS